MAKFDTVTLPVYWSSYLINGDASGLEPGEREHIDAYLEKEGVEYVLDCEEDSRFTWSYRLYGGQAEGGEVCDYTVELENPSA